jgi:VCBS repeat-containing protein
VIHSRGESFDAREGAAAIAVEPGSAVVTVPDAHFLFTADFKRKGPDLVLTGEDGRKILVPDYFRQEKQPDLVSPEGAILSASVIELLTGTATPGQYAQAGAPAAPQPIGRVETVAGSATVVRNGVAVDLNVGDLVFQGDVVQTLSNSALAIAFSDGSAFTLNENARMALNEFVYDPNSTANSALISLVQGTVSFIAAQVAKTGNMRVETPTAVLGIRGTFITLSVSSVDGHTVASLGLETHPVTGEQFSGAFTLTNRITGNLTTVNQINSIFSVSPGGATSESPKPPDIHALEQATFQALVPVVAAATNLAATLGPGQGQNLNQNLNQNPNQNPAQDGGQNASPGPSPGGSGGANTAPTNQSPTDSPPTLPSGGPPAPSGAPPAGPTTGPSPTNTPAVPPVTPTPATTPATTTTGSVTEAEKTETATSPDGGGGSTNQGETGTANNAPTITSPDPHIQVTETTTTGSPALQSKSASLAFTDPDLNDVGYTVSVLGVAASGVIAGLPDAATLLTLLHPTGAKAAGSTQGVINATFSASEQTFDYLWAGETVTLTYTLQVADGHGGTSTQTFTVTATGTNDLPVISGPRVLQRCQQPAV